MKLVVRPISDSQREIALTHQLVAAIADELWRLCGGNKTLNWLDAERHLRRIIAQTRAEAREAVVVRVAPSVPDQMSTRRTQPAQWECDATR